MNFEKPEKQKIKKIAGDIIILHMSTKSHNHMRYSSWDTEWWDNFLLSFHFGPFFALLPRHPKKKQKKNRKPNSWKNEKSIWRCHHFKLVQQKHDQIMYAYSDMECNRHNFCHFRPSLAFTQLLTPKIKIWKKCKKYLQMLSFYTCTPKIKIIWCMVPQISSTTNRIFCHSGLFFALLPP